MKREIKFRAWIPNTGWLADGFSIAMDGTEWYDDNGHSWPLSQLEIMQFTGLKDKNGKEIYEGDIVELCGTGSEFDGVLFEIGFRMGSFEMQKEDDLPPLSFIYMAVQLREKNKIVRDYQTMNYIKVIGNIYENPDLLTSPK